MSALNLEDLIILCQNRNKITADHVKKEAKSLWISVEERLPEKSGEYITMTRNAEGVGAVMAQDYEITTVRGKNVQRWRRHDRISPWEVTHWMPLPKPPKTETAE